MLFWSGVILKVNKSSGTHNFKRTVLDSFIYPYPSLLPIAYLLNTLFFLLLLRNHLF